MEFIFVQSLNQVFKGMRGKAQHIDASLHRIVLQSLSTRFAQKQKIPKFICCLIQNFRSSK